MDTIYLRPYQGWEWTCPKCNLYQTEGVEWLPEKVKCWECQTEYKVYDPAKSISAWKRAAKHWRDAALGYEAMFDAIDEARQ